MSFIFRPNPVTVKVFFDSVIINFFLIVLKVLFILHKVVAGIQSLTRASFLS